MSNNKAVCVISVFPKVAVRGWSDDSSLIKNKRVDMRLRKKSQLCGSVLEATCAEYLTGLPAFLLHCG